MTPLDGIKVLDFSHALAGPYATLLLADYGADVYKLEAPGGSDMGRGWGPPFLGGEAAFFLGLNRGKQGISIDLKTPAGIDLCLLLLEKMDVLIENFRPGTMDRLGLGYARVRVRNPRLVYCSISGYGQDGPSREETAMDLIVQCSSGLVSITGNEAGEQARCGYSVADVTAGMFGVIGILMALRAREKTGEGQYVDVAMQDCMISTMTSNYMTYLASGVPPKPLGTGFATVAPYRVFEAKDRGFSLAVGSEKLWSSFCKAIGRPELEAHPDFATNAARCSNRPELERLLGEIFGARAASDWIAELRAAGIPCTLVRNFEEVAQDPQAAFRGMFPTVDHPTAGPHRVTGSPIKFSGTPGHLAGGAPLAGEHTWQALQDLLGLSSQALRELRESGAIFAPDSL
jgi:crotonobetainyl-CoA:carnitine CoA-transferase CaiB-like acyl-CoA transferase